MASLSSPLASPLGGDSTDANSFLDPATERELFGVDLLFTDDLQLTAGGDYITLSGYENLKQAILNRLQTRPGEFRIRPEYGVGVGLYVKRAMTTSLLAELKQRIVSNLSQESRIDRVSQVSVEKWYPQGRPGLKVLVQVVAKGRPLAFDYQFQEHG